jgi:flagellar basal body L-ring protein FlgH
LSEDSGGPNLASGEFGRQQGQFDDKARRGYRRNVDPWTSSGPYNENSLWNPESQDGFYFTRNNMLRVGDFIVVSLDADLMENLNNRLVKMYRTKKTTKDVVAEETGKAVGAKVGEAINKAVKNDAVSKAVGADVAERAEESIKGNQRFFTTKEIPVRVTEITTKGLLRVQGEKTLFLKNASFELKLGGLMREEDIGPTRSIASSRVIDSKVEITK